MTYYQRFMMYGPGLEQMSDEMNATRSCFAQHALPQHSDNDRFSLLFFPSFSSDVVERPLFARSFLPRCCTYIHILSMRFNPTRYTLYDSVQFRRPYYSLLFFFFYSELVSTALFPCVDTACYIVSPAISQRPAVGCLISLNRVGD